MGQPEDGPPDTVPDHAVDLDEAEIARAASLIGQSDDLVAFTGAGASTESGIPDFRSPGGMWDQFDPRDFTIQALRADPVAYWEQRLEMQRTSGIDWTAVEPNPAHTAIARLGAEGPLSHVITQNVDGLHQVAGNDPDRVLELHGTRTAAKCLGCEQRRPLSVLEAQLEEEPLPPRCADCGGLLKRATVAFGEALPSAVLSAAERAVRNCDCCLVVGSSLEVQPAASLPRTAHAAGASVIVVNLEPTPIDDAADAVIHGRAGDALQRIVDRTL